MPNQVASANIAASSSLTAHAGLDIPAIALITTSAAAIGFAHQHLHASDQILADSTSATGSVAQRHASTASITAGSTAGVNNAGAGQEAEAFIIANSLVQANVTAQRHAIVHASASAALTPNSTGDYAGTTAHLSLPGAVLTGQVSARYRAGENIAGSSTFTTWRILAFDGNFTGHGILADLSAPVRVVYLTGQTLSGAGALTVTYVPDVPMLAGASITADAVVHHQAQATLVAGSAATANAQVPKPAAAIVGGASVTAHASVHRAARAWCYPNSNLTAHGATQTVSILAGSSAAAHARLRQVLRSRIFGDSTLSGSATIPAAKIASVAMAARASVVAAPVVIPAGSQAALIVASSSVVAHATLDHGQPIQEQAPVVEVILGAQFSGAGTVKDGLLMELSGTLSGAGAITGTAASLIMARALAMVGAGTLGDSMPLPMIGAGILSGYFDLQRLPRPICPCPPRRVKVFRWGDTFTRGGLELAVCDDSGNPYAPVVVLYAFYQIVAGGQRMLVGPPNRRPAVDTSEGKVGRYYATGTAGELGQPGNWVIVWRYQRSWWTDTQFLEEPFQVHDEVTSGVPGSLNGRCRKYGWL